MVQQVDDGEQDVGQQGKEGCVGASQQKMEEYAVWEEKETCVVGMD